jgi:hypothetical protein
MSAFQLGVAFVPFLVGFAVGTILGFIIVKWVLFGMIREGSLLIDERGKLRLNDGK